MNDIDPLFVGLMSGTSVDAIDSALVRCRDKKVDIIATHQHPIPLETKKQIATISHSGPDEIERMGVLDRKLGLLFAEATLQLLAAAKTLPIQVKAIGSHGQTIRHRPPSVATCSAESFSLQIGDPNTIAENTGITTVADFRSRDIAAGGQGAPLAPAFHAAAFAKPGIHRAIINIGGIANASLLEGTELLMGFDTGPGNTLLDHWISRCRGESFDRDGHWSATGQIDQELLAMLLMHPYFNQTGPRSTGKEDFNLAWLDNCLAEFDSHLTPVNVQATLVELTSTSIARAIRNSPLDIAEIYICGGGSHNLHLMQRLTEILAPATVASTSAIGMDPDWVEAATFAWLASRTLDGLAGNSPAVTGASGARVLGGIYPAVGMQILKSLDGEG
ncbi:MAG TPA: anhydro-N-acetylmuramic acid kinase [Halioglobus sp.]